MPGRLFQRGAGLVHGLVGLGLQPAVQAGLFFVNGKRVANRSLDGFKQMIDDALKAKG